MTRALILAAGGGTRYKSFTRDLPRCMLPLGGSTLLDRQLETFEQAGVTTVGVVTGWHGDKIVSDRAFTRLDNPNFATTHTLGSLFAHPEFLDDDVIVTYADILFGPTALKTLLESPHDLTLLHDADWQAHYIGRLDKSLGYAETLVSAIDSPDQVELIGRELPFAERIVGELVGLMRFKGHGLDQLKSLYAKRAASPNTPYYQARRFHNAALTDLLQDHIDADQPVHTLGLNHDWLEIDSVLNYEAALTTVEQHGFDALFAAN